MPQPIGLSGVRGLRLSAEHATIDLETATDVRIGERLELAAPRLLIRRISPPLTRKGHGRQALAPPDLAENGLGKVKGCWMIQ
jgi:hypothetical protein